MPLGLFRALMSDVALAHGVVPKLEWGRFQDFPGAVGKAMNTQRSGLVTRPKMCPSKERRCWRMEPDSGRARAEGCSQACSASQGFARRGFSSFSSGGLLRAFALLTCIPTPEGGQTAATSKPRPLEQRSPTPVAPGTSSSYAHLPPDGIRWSRGGEAGAGRAGEAAHKAGLVLVSGQSPSTAAEKHNLA